MLPPPMPVREGTYSTSVKALEAANTCKQLTASSTNTHRMRPSSSVWLGKMEVNDNMDKLPKTPPQRFFRQQRDITIVTPTSPSHKSSRYYSFRRKEAITPPSNQLVLHEPSGDAFQKYNPAIPSSITNSAYFGDITSHSRLLPNVPLPVQRDPNSVPWPRNEDKMLFTIMNGETQYKITTTSTSSAMWNDVHRAFKTELPDSRRTKKDLRDYWIAQGGKDMDLDEAESQTFEMATQDVEEEEVVRLIIYRYHQLTSKWLAYPAAERLYRDLKRHQREQKDTRRNQTLYRAAKRSREPDEEKSKKRRKTGLETVEEDS